MTEDDVYAVLKETGALLRGHFQLRSGLHSPEFFQCANLLRYPRRAERLCPALAAVGPLWRQLAAIDAVAGRRRA